MSRLDRHVARVQNKLALGRFLHALAWAGVVCATVVWIGILIDKIFRVHPPHPRIWILVGIGLTTLVALVYAIVRRPSRHEAAVAIDDRLALKEKFSTALFVRPMTDPFAQAAVKDAEQTADNVSLYKRFPLQFPRASVGALLIALAAFTTASMMRPLDLFGKQQQRDKQVVQVEEAKKAKKEVERALAVVNAMPKGAADEETIKQAKKDLQAMLNQPIRDPDKTKRSAARALQDLDAAIKQQMASNQKIADAQNDAKAFRSITPPGDEKGPVADAQRKIAQGKFDEAVADLSKAVEKFNKMDAAEQKKAAEQMKQMAAAMQKMANDPKVQEQIQQQMQQMGLNQQQAQEAAKMMQQAANGDKQAQQQLAQMANQAMQKMTPQQKAAAQQMMKQMQAQANTKAQAQQMANAAQQMAQAMQQAGQGQNGQQAAQQGAQQQMAKGQAAMQQQLQQMQAMKADAQQIAAAQQNAADAAADAANALNGGKGAQQDKMQDGKWQGNNNGQWNQGENRQFKGPNNGMGGAGIGAGDRTFKEQAPYATKPEISTSPDIEGGKILASTFVKAQTVKGESTVGAEWVAPPPEQEATDDIEQDRISRPAQQAVKDYFRAWQKDAENK